MRNFFVRKEDYFGVKLLQQHFRARFDFEMLPTICKEFTSLLDNFEHFMWKNLTAILLINPTSSLVPTF